MDFSFLTRSILQFLALLFFFVLWKRRRSTAPTKTSVIKPIPEPPRALPIIGHLHLLAGQVHDPACKILGAIADKYGPIYSLRFGINRLIVVSSWECVKDCFTTNDRAMANRANIIAGKYIGYDNAIFSLAPYGQYWRDVRKLATLQLFSVHRIEMLKHVRLSETDMLMKDLYKLCGAHHPVNLKELLEDLTFNISLRMVVGKRFCVDRYGEENSEAWRFKKAISEALLLFGTFVLADAIPWLERLDIQGHVKAMKKNSKKLDAVIQTWMEEHLRKRSEGEGDVEGDFMDVLIGNLAEGSLVSGFTRDIVIKATTLMLTMTGAGSTSVTLTWAISLLLNHPNVLKTAQEELNTHVGKSKWVQESDIQNLKYLQAILKETLRLYPPGPLTGIREATEDCYVGGYLVPKGSRLVVDIWKLQRDPRVWENPNEFEPERFLKAHSEVDFRGQNFEYIPFGSGRRSCPAINLGIQVVQLVLARLIQGFDFMTVDGLPVDMREGPGLSLPKLEPLKVAVKPRLGSKMYESE